MGRWEGRMREEGSDVRYLTRPGPEARRISCRPHEKQLLPKRAAKIPFLAPDSWSSYSTSGGTLTFVVVRLGLESVELRGAVPVETIPKSRERRSP